MIISRKIRCTFFIILFLTFIIGCNLPFGLGMEAPEMSLEEARFQLTLQPTGTPTITPTPKPTNTTSPTSTDTPTPVVPHTATLTPLPLGMISTSTPTNTPTPTPTFDSEITATPIPSVAISSQDVLVNGSFELDWPDYLPVAPGWTIFEDSRSSAAFQWQKEMWEDVIFDGEQAQFVAIAHVLYNTDPYRKAPPETLPEKEIPLLGRFSGIYQTVNVVPGGEYELTIRGLIRSQEGSNEQSDFGYSVQYAIDHLGGSDWRIIPTGDWTDVNLPEYPYTEPVHWTDEYYDTFSGYEYGKYSIKFRPSTNRITLFIRAVKKWATSQEGIINFDGISIRGTGTEGETELTTVQDVISSISNTPFCYPGEWTDCGGLSGHGDFARCGALSVRQCQEDGTWSECLPHYARCSLYAQAVKEERPFVFPDQERIDLTEPQQYFQVNEFGRCVEYEEEKCFVRYRPRGCAIKAVVEDFERIYYIPTDPNYQFITVDEYDNREFWYCHETDLLQENWYWSGNNRFIPPTPIPVDKMAADIPWLLYQDPYIPGVYSYAFNISKPPFNDLLVRKAFSAAINRRKIARFFTSVTSWDAIPATTFIPPDVLGLSLYNEVGTSYNPDQARLYLAQAGYEDGTTLPPITLIIPEEDMSASIAVMILEMWRDILKVENIETHAEINTVNTYFEQIKDDPPQLFVWMWALDIMRVFDSEYEFRRDPDDFLRPLFYTKVERNLTRFSNERFDLFLTQAANNLDPLTRQNLYVQAERVLVDEETAIIPLFHTDRFFIEGTFDIGECEDGCVIQPPTCLIKGDITLDQQKLMYLPGGADYDSVIIEPSRGERWFCTVDEAIDGNNGWNRARSYAR